MSPFQKAAGTGHAGCGRIQGLHAGAVQGKPSDVVYGLTQVRTSVGSPLDAQQEHDVGVVVVVPHGVDAQVAPPGPRSLRSGRWQLLRFSRSTPIWSASCTATICSALGMSRYEPAASKSRWSAALGPFVRTNMFRREWMS